ncbi:MAG TPA: hypothetical protein DEB39_14115 [Planctomycetaceae bacterium]|nr:hypothetical protein [Planctomycetaceae bacterium]
MQGFARNADSNGIPDRKTFLDIIFADAPRDGSYLIQGKSIRIDSLERHVFIKSDMPRQVRLCDCVQIFETIPQTT